MRAICLPRFSMGNGWLRFICYSRTSGRFYLSPDCQAGDVLLFLGADLVSTCNNNNIHTKYWNKGLCIKVSFQGAVVEGIPNSKGLWFYTVQGVFRCAFTHLDHIQQKDILTNLLDYWLRWDEAANKMPRAFTVTLDSLGCVPNSCSLKEKDKIDAGKRAPPSVAESQVIFHSLSQSDCVLTTDTTEITDDNINIDPSHSFVESEPQNRSLNVEKISNSISATFHKMEDESHQQQLLHALSVTCRYFESLSPNDNANLFLFNILETYTNLISKSPTLTKSGVPDAKRHDLMLYVVCGWLGDEFLHLKNHIQEEVTKFKQTYIRQIDRLPGPRTLVQELFPACMVELLERWTGVGVKQICQEHNYIKRSVEETDRHTCNYTTIQLILELVNKTLISGTSHAMYSQLAHVPD